MTNDKRVVMRQMPVVDPVLEIQRDDFVRLVAAIEGGELDVVIVRDVDRLTRNLTDWNRFEKACVRHGVLLSPYWFGYVRVYANPDEPVARKRVILREELHPVNAPALREAAERILHGESVGSVIRDWDARGIRPVSAAEWSQASFVGSLTSPRIAGLMSWHGQPPPYSPPSSTGSLSQGTSEGSS